MSSIEEIYQISLVFQCYHLHQIFIMINLSRIHTMAGHTHIKFQTSLTDVNNLKILILNLKLVSIYGIILSYWSSQDSLTDVGSFLFIFRIVSYRKSKTINSILISLFIYKNCKKILMIVHLIHEPKMSVTFF